MATYGRAKTFIPKTEKKYEELTSWEKFHGVYSANFKKLSDVEIPVWREFVDKCNFAVLEKALDEVTAEYERQSSSGYQVKSPSLPRIKAAYWGIFKNQQRKEETFSGRGCGKCSTLRKIDGELRMVPTGTVMCVCEISTGRPLYPGKIEAIQISQIGDFACPCSCDAGKNFPIEDGKTIGNKIRGEFARCAFGAGCNVSTLDMLDYMESCDDAYKKLQKIKTEGKDAGFNIVKELEGKERKIKENKNCVKKDEFFGAIEIIESELSEIIKF